MRCPYVQNMVTGQVESEPAGPNDAGIERSLRCFAEYINSMGLGDGGNMISYGGRPVAGFGVLDNLGLSGADIYNALSSDQRTWLASAMQTFEGARRDAGASACPEWPQTFQTVADFQAAVACTQAWINAGNPGLLRTDGVMDESTLCAIQFEAYKMPPYAQNRFPDPSGKFCKSMTTTEKKSNTVYYVAGGVAAALAVGAAIVYSRKRAA